MRDLPSGTVTFLFSDVEGSTRLLHVLGDRYPQTHAEHQRLVRRAWSAHEGVEVSTEGDSFFVAFPSPAAALQAAAEAHRSLAAHTWPDGGMVRVRVGVHTGQAVVMDDNYVGLDVNRAARITAAGHGGQTLVSETTRDAVGDTVPPGLTLTDLGRHRLKDVGTVRLFQLEGEGLAAGFGTLRTLEEHPTNLPAFHGSLIDREDERAAVAALVTETPIVTVTGAGGIGKTRLAVQVARDVLLDFPDGAFYVDVAALDRAEQAAAAVAQTLELRVPDDQPVARALPQILRDRHALIVLDTADRVAGLPRMLAAIAAACRRVRFLVTSRSALHVSAEREVPLAPLDVGPTSRDEPVEAIAASPAVQLFVARAQAVRPDFVLTPENAYATARICARVDGLPLAIELAAARVRVLPPATLLARLEQSLSLLAGGAQDAPDRQRTLRDTIAWSYELLEPPEQALLQRLSVFHGAFDLEGLEAIAAAAKQPVRDVDGRDVFAAFEALVDRSLVARAAADEPRFRLLATIRDFAAEALDASGDADAVQEAHARHWLAIARSLSSALEGDEDIDAAARLNREMAELRSAVDWALRRSADLALELTAALGRFLWLRGHVREGLDWLERSLARAPAGNDEARAQAAYWAGVLHDGIGEFEAARTRLEEAASLFARLGDAFGEARALNSLAVAFRSLGDLDRAEVLLHESLARKRALHDRRGIATTLTNLGIVEVDRQRYGSARALFEEALALDRAVGARGAAAYSELGLATAMLAEGHLADAEQAARTSLATFGELEDAEGVADALTVLAKHAVAQSGGERALRLSLVASAIRRREGIPVRDLDAGDLARTESAAAALVDPAVLSAVRADADAFDLSAAVAFGLGADAARAGAADR